MRSLLTAALVAGLAASPAHARDVQAVTGQCTSDSHTAEGPIGSDLTKHQSRFYCDAAGVITFDKSPGHMLIQFAKSKAHNAASLGFGGTLDPDGIIMPVGRVYLDNKQMPTSDGGCKFFFKGRHLDEIFCFAVVDKQGRRNAVAVSFKVDAQQGGR